MAGVRTSTDTSGEPAGSGSGDDTEEQKRETVRDPSDPAVPGSAAAAAAAAATPVPLSYAGYALVDTSHLGTKGGGKAGAQAQAEAERGTGSERWREVWLVLQATVLHMYASPAAAQERGNAALRTVALERGMAVRECTRMAPKTAFTLSAPSWGAGRTMRIRTISHSELCYWLEDIRNNCRLL